MAISDRRSLPGGDLLAWAGRLAAAGVDALQLREKNLEDGMLAALAQGLRAAFPPPGRLLVNGRMDVAWVAGADGVHLPAAGLPATELRRRLGSAALIGRSTHSLAEVADAAEEGVDYVTFGPIYTTPSKAAYGPPRGLAELTQVSRVGVPVLALGGVSGERLAELAAAGAVGAAGIRAFRSDRRGLEALVTVAAECFPR